HQFPNVEISFIQPEVNFRSLFPDEIIIDALFGSGLNRQLEGVTASLVGHLNTSGNKIISIDIPSGMSVDRSSKGNVIVKADHTLMFQCLKPAFLVAENAEYAGKLHILDIGLQETFLRSITSLYEWIDMAVIHFISKP